MASLALAAAIVLAPRSVRTGALNQRCPVLIIDAGHGGADGGAEAPDGSLESDINLDIALRLRALAAFWGLETVMTRETTEIDYPTQANTLSKMKQADQNTRLRLINSIPDGVLVSIHQNTYPSSAPNGIQVFYGTVSGSDKLAVVMQDKLTKTLCSENRRVAAPIDESIYLMRKADCPAVLVECGFLSNPADLERLESASYRMQLAAVMLTSYLEYTKGNTI